MKSVSLLFETTEGEWMLSFFIFFLVYSASFLDQIGDVIGRFLFGPDAAQVNEEESEDKKVMTDIPSSLDEDE